MKKLLIAILFVLVTVSGFAAGTTTVDTGDAVTSMAGDSAQKFAVATPTLATHAANKAYVDNTIAVRYSAGVSAGGIATFVTDITWDQRNFLTFQAVSATNNGYSGHYGGLTTSYDGTYHRTFYTTSDNGNAAISLNGTGGVVNLVLTFSGATSGSCYVFIRNSYW
jgi:hypothetical protein